jgi:gas vesicle protein
MDRQQLTMLGGGVGLGAALMYAFDPDRGKRRRAGVRDKLVSATDKAADAVSVTARDLRNRARGLYASSMSQNDMTSDEVLVARVRSKMGRVVSHPSAIEVSADQGRITLKGPILADESNNLLTTVSKISDVAEVDNQLEIHEEAGDVPALQGGKKRLGDRFELMQENWSPTARLLTSTAGGAALVYGLIRRNPMCLLVGTVGAGLLLRGVTNVELKRLIGIGDGHREEKL